MRPFTHRLEAFLKALIDPLFEAVFASVSADIIGGFGHSFDHIVWIGSQLYAMLALENVEIDGVLVGELAE